MNSYLSTLGISLSPLSLLTNTQTPNPPTHPHAHAHTRAHTHTHTHTHTHIWCRVFHTVSRAISSWLGRTSSLPLSPLLKPRGGREGERVRAENVTMEWRKQRDTWKRLHHHPALTMCYTIRNMSSSRR